MAAGTSSFASWVVPGIPGLAAGRQIMADGTPGLVRGVLVMLNPRYSLTADG